MEGRASISPEILASYAADAAREVPGVSGLVESRLPPHRGVRITDEEGRVSVEVHLAVEWGPPIPELAGAVQAGVRRYLARMADVDPVVVDVVVDEIGPRPR